jgi:hypothetical protein
MENDCLGKAEDLQPKGHNIMWGIANIGTVLLIVAILIAMVISVVVILNDARELLKFAALAFVIITAMGFYRFAKKVRFPEPGFFAVGAGTITAILLVLTVIFFAVLR